MIITVPHVTPSPLNNRERYKWPCGVAATAVTTATIVKAAITPNEGDTI